MVILLTQPALLLVDFGHFQYNSVMLGSFSVGHFQGVIIDRSSATALTLLSVNYMCKGQDLVAAVFFVASLGFKQMALYYAPAVGSYLFAKCIYLGQKNGHVVPFFFPLLFIILIQKPHAGVDCSYSSAL